MKIVRKDLVGNAVNEAEIQKLITENSVCNEILSTIIKAVTEANDGQ